MTLQIPYIITDDIVPQLLEFCAAQNHPRFFLIADDNTYRVLGRRVEAALSGAGIDVKTILLTGDEIATDEHFAIQVLIETAGEDRNFIAVGSGTITDLTRFASHRSRATFISLPTAPSVDGYTSTVAPMIVSNYKATIAAHAPAAVFADLPTLCSAPRLMIAAGLGDLLGKYTSLADWRLGALLYDEPYDFAIDQMMRESVDRVIETMPALAETSCEGITALMDGLIGSGFGMLQFGDSRPASGSEHHIAHLWEMRFIQEGKPAVLHGAKVGVATILMAANYERLSRMTKDQAAQRLQARGLPRKEFFLSEIEQGYGPAAGLIREIQYPLLEMTPTAVQALRSRILDHWEEICAIAQTVPPAGQLTAWLETLGGPTRPEHIGLSPRDVELGLTCAHYLRDRFTLNRLTFWLSAP